MDVALLHRGGCYEVDSASGNTYKVDLLDETCTCPDYQTPDTPTPCKHLQRVQLELDAGRIPRPDGRLPETALSTYPPSDTSSTHLVATLRTRIQEREERIAALEAEIQALQFVCDVADAVRDGKKIDLKQIIADEYGPASRL
ncbi:SWIM zinc finger family protein [Halorarius halobius]|uniref:SWIM zinc finger family protein n=1 Tax=Halorarius halobius TaxID=2962671 RepID=UPI0020CC3659|nr:SWIM zinc finger family protein [Halorarius halobius]